MAMRNVYDGKGHKFLVFTRKRIALGATILVVVFIFIAINDPAIVETSATKRALPIYCVERDNKAVSLTFDAAWGNENTQKLIDILGRYNVKATFFVVGMWVDKYPESVKELSDAGHEVMNHSNNHEHFSKMSAEEIFKNITTCNDKIAAVTGVVPILFRAPFG